MGTAYCVWEGLKGSPAKEERQTEQRQLESPLTSSSDSLCGTEKQLVTSTECLSTVPVREDCPVLCDPKAPNRLRPPSSCFQTFSRLARDHHLNPSSPRNLPVNLQHQCQLLPQTSLLVLTLYSHCAHLFSAPPKRLAPRLLFSPTPIPGSMCVPLHQGPQCCLYLLVSNSTSAWFRSLAETMSPKPMDRPSLTYMTSQQHLRLDHIKFLR